MATTKTELLNNGVVVATRTAAPFYSWDWTPSISGASSLTYKRYEDSILVFTSGAITGTVEAPVTANLLLDDYPNAKLAYSFRKLRTAYEGAAIRVRRSSDNTFKDINFLNGVLDTASLLSFVGSGDGFVHTIYDQSLNGINWVNENSIPGGPQPKIVSSGALVFKNSKPVMFSTGGTMSLDVQIAITSALSTDFTVLTDTNGFGGTGFSQGGTYAYGYFHSGSTVAINSPGVGTPSLYVNNSIFTGNRGDLYTLVNAGLKVLATTNIDMRSFTTLSLDNTATGIIFPPSHFAEKIIYESDQEVNRVAIQNNINAYYGIY